MNISLDHKHRSIEVSSLNVRPKFIIESTGMDQSAREEARQTEKLIGEGSGQPWSCCGDK